MKNLIFVFLLIGLVACSSSPYKVVETLDNDSKPSWASLGKTHWKEDGQVFAVGMAEGVEPDRITALMRIADNNAKTEITRLLANEVGVDFKNIEAGMRGEGEYSFLGSEKSQVMVQELAPSARYFEKLMLKSNEDAPIKIHFYSLVSIPETTYNRLLKEGKEKMTISAPTSISTLEVASGEIGKQ